MAADSETQQQPSSIAETYGDWTVQCQASTSEDTIEVTRNCQISQELKQASTGNRVLLFAIYSLDDGGAAATIVAPFGLLLSKGVVFSVDEKELSTAEFQTCMPVGCIAKLSLRVEQLRIAQAGETLGVNTVASNGQKLLTNMSLNGFKAAIARLDELSQGE